MEIKMMMMMMNYLIYTAATVITERVTQPRKTMKNKRFKDFWKIRIQKQINRWTIDLSILTESGSGSDNIKLNTKKGIFQQYKVTNAEEAAELIEKLKQKIQAKAQRIRRYEEINKKQYTNNKMFEEDTNRFY
jgi:K+-transporting ATPase c subunit